MMSNARSYKGVENSKYWRWWAGAVILSYVGQLLLPDNQAVVKLCSIVNIKLFVCVARSVIVVSV